MRLRAADDKEVPSFSSSAMRKEYSSSSPYSSSGENKYSKRSRKGWKCTQTAVLLALVTWAAFIVGATYFFFEIELNLLSNTNIIKDAVISSTSAGHRGESAKVIHYPDEFPPEFEEDEERMVGGGQAPEQFSMSSGAGGPPKRKPFTTKQKASKYLESKNKPKEEQVLEADVDLASGGVTGDFNDRHQEPLEKPKILDQEGKVDSHEGEVIDSRAPAPAEMELKEETKEQGPQEQVPPPVEESKEKEQEQNPQEQVPPPVEESKEKEEDQSPQEQVPPPVEEASPTKEKDSDDDESEEEKPKIPEQIPEPEPAEIQMPPMAGEDSKLGADGSPVSEDELNDEDREKIEENKHLFGYYDVISRKISVRRNVPDTRDDWCKSGKHYDKLKLTASVIISVYNEAWTVLLRSIHSILERTPAQLLKEIVIVDDFSDESFDYMIKALPKYLQSFEKVKLFRTVKREGLIKARLWGKEQTSGDVLIFLDSHVEVNHQWLEPLLQRIQESGENVVVPMIDPISPETFEYNSGSKEASSVDTFLWDLTTEKSAPSSKARKNQGQSHAAPIETPISISGQFAISRNFFDLVGGFDPQLNIYGGENLELSWKTWMCGGRLEIVPCSRIGHVNREKLAYLTSQPMDEERWKNYLRISRVWMDDYSVYFSNSDQVLDKLEYGDIKERLILKEELQCKSFEWYLDTVYPQLYDLKKNAIADTEIRSLGMDGSLCMDSTGRKGATVVMYPCHGQGGNQRWWYTTKGELRRNDQCMDYWGDNIGLYPCHGLKGNQLWKYNVEKQTIKHAKTYKCVTVTSESTVGMEACEEATYSQQWVMDRINMTAYQETGFDH